MKPAARYLAIAVLGAALHLTLGTAAAEERDSPAAKPDAAAQIASLDWLAGTWAGAVGPGTWEAVYTTPAGGEVMSTNKEIRKGKVVSFEFERFFVKDGKVVMTPYVKGINTVAFTLTQNDPKARRAIFENPKHDFPQRIDYHRRSDDLLHIGVYAKRDGKWAGFELKLNLLK